MFVSSASAVTVEHVLVVVHSWDHAAVDIQGDSHTTMTQNIGHSLGMLTLHETNCGARVPEVVESYPR